MNEKVTKFYEIVSADGELQEELQVTLDGVNLEDVSEEEARAAIVEAVAAFAAEHDLDLTAEDLLAADAERAEGELSDAELEGIAGGGCGCFVVGGVKGCGCFMVGAAKGTPDEDKTICPVLIGY